MSMKIFSTGGAHSTESKSDALVKWMTRPCCITFSDVLKASAVVLFGIIVAVLLISQVRAESLAAKAAQAQTVELVEFTPVPTAEPAEVVSVDQTLALAMGIDAVVSSVRGGDTASDITMLMVGNTIMNRVEDSRYPNTVDQVLCQPKQFSCFADSGLKWVGKAATDTVWQQRCMDAAERVLNGERMLSYGVVYVSTSKQGTVEAQLDGLYFCR